MYPRSWTIAATVVLGSATIILSIFLLLAVNANESTMRLLSADTLGMPVFSAFLYLLGFMVGGIFLEHAQRDITPFDHAFWKSWATGIGCPLMIIGQRAVVRFRDRAKPE